MKSPTIAETIEQKKTRLAQRLMELKNVWPYAERLQWCVTNAYNPDSIRKLYFMGDVNSIPVAESLLSTIEKYMHDNNIAA